jgi:RecB family exonuclease
VQVLAHPDPCALEEALLDRIARIRAASALEPILVLVPTARLASHVRRRVAQRLGACLQLEVAHHRSVVLEILARHQPGLALAGSPLLRTLLEGVLATEPGDPWSRFGASRPGARTALLDALGDLREAGVTPAALAAAIPADASPADRALASLYRRWVEALEKSQATGLVDEAGLVGAACRHAESWARRFRAVLHHGAYELTGSHLDLVRAIDRGREVVFLLPGEPGSPAAATAERFAARHLLRQGRTIERLPQAPLPRRSLLGDRLGSLGVEHATFEPLAPGAVALRHAQGAAAEIAFASRRALRAVAAGAAPLETAIVARSLSPYVPFLEEAMGAGEGSGGALPFATSASVALRRDPWVRDALLVVRVLAHDFPRALTAELLRSPRMGWRKGGDLAESWSRQARVLGGLASWTEDLPAWAGRSRTREDATDEEREAEAERAEWRRARAGEMAGFLAALAGEAPQGADSWSAHARAIAALVERRLPPGPPSPAVRALLDLVASMGRLDDFLGEGRAVPFARAAAWLEEAVEGTPLPLRPEDDGGIRVLDAMQARGLTFDHVLVLGMHEGSFPQPPGVDPVLSDGLRRRVREATGRPLAVRDEAADEERLLLGLVLGAARERLEISRQRADETGRARSPSTALREVARLVCGRPELARVLAAETTVHAHPQAWLDDLARDTGLLREDEAVVRLGLRSPGPAAMQAALGDPGPLAPGLAMMAAIESFDPGDGAFDGRVGSEFAPQRLSVSALEELGLCPRKFFFHHVLRVRELDSETSADRLRLDDIGIAVHRVLERLYRELDTDGLFSPGRLASARRRAAERLPVYWDEAVSETGASMRARLPALWRLTSQGWIRRLAAFVDEDLVRLAAEGWRPTSFELKCEMTFPRDPEITVHGRLDRVMAGPDGRVRVGDYKSSGHLPSRMKLKSMFQGSRLQIPVYSLLAAHRGGVPRTDVELLGIGPAYDRLAPEERRPLFSGFEGSALEGFEETLGVLLDLAESGRFPLLRDPLVSRNCSWCAYRTACRRTHAPTREREAEFSDAARYRLLHGKTGKKILFLSGVSITPQDEEEVWDLEADGGSP